MRTVQQLGLFDQLPYDVPTLVEEQEVMVYDADEWEEYNGLYGVIVRAPLPERGYFVKLETGQTRHFAAREVMKVACFCQAKGDVIND